MSLPKIQPPRSMVDIEGEIFDIRGLTRAEAARCQQMVAADSPWSDLEVYVISAATDTPLDEVKAWYAATAGHVVQELVEAIQTLSRLDEGARKSGAESDSDR